MPSLRGKFLIASSRLADPNFAQTVTLLIQHDEHGALGLVVNRPLEMTVRQAAEQVLETPCLIDGPLYQGGPCDGPLMAVHTSEVDSDTEVSPGIYFTTEKQKLESLLTQPVEAFKFFVGYAGWGPGQLEMEFEAGSWLTSPGTVERIFTDDDEVLWKGLITSTTLGKWMNPKQIPDDPSVN